MNQPTFVRPLPDGERPAWRTHNLQILAESALLLFEETFAILEDAREMIIAIGCPCVPVTGRLRKFAT